MMYKIIHNLIKGSTMSRNCIILSNYRTIQSRVHLSQDAAVKQLKDNYGKLKEEQNSLNLHNNLEGFIKKSLQDYKSINKDNVVETMNNLYKMFIKHKALCNIDLTNIKEFEYMCNLIVKNARFFNTYDTLSILQSLTFFNIHPNTIIMQTLFQLLRVSLNNLTVGQIIMTYQMLKKLNNHFSDSLCVGLSRAFKQQAQIELDSKSTNLLKALKFCSTIEDTNTKIYIIGILSKNTQLINSENVTDVYNALYSLPKLCISSKEVLSHVENMIINDTAHMKYKNIEKLLFWISTKYIQSKVEFYNERVIDALCVSALKLNNTFYENLSLLSHLNKMLHCNTPLLNCLTNTCRTDKNIFKSSKLTDINELIKGFVIANYKSSSWKSIEEMLLNTITNIDCSVNSAAFIAFRLLSLNCYYPELLKQVFSMCNNASKIILKKETLSIAFNLHWCVKLLYPEYEGIMLDESKLNEIEIENEGCNVPYSRESLEKAVGGNEYVKSCLNTKVGAFVEHVVVIQPDGSLMNISSYENITFAEELASLSDCSKILFFAFPQNAYCSNNKNMLSTVKMQLKAIETMPGFYPFVINQYLWEKFSKNDMVLYLQEAIKTKCSNVIICNK